MILIRILSTTPENQATMWRKRRRGVKRRRRLTGYFIIEGVSHIWHRSKHRLGRDLNQSILVDRINRVVVVDAGRWYVGVSMPNYDNKGQTNRYSEENETIISRATLIKSAQGIALFLLQRLEAAYVPFQMQINCILFYLQMSQVHNHNVLIADLLSSLRF